MVVLQLVMRSTNECQVFLARMSCNSLNLHLFGYNICEPIVDSHDYTRSTFIATRPEAVMRGSIMKNMLKKESKINTTKNHFLWHESNGEGCS